MTVSVSAIIYFLCHNWKCCRIVNVSFYPPGLLSVALGNNSDSFRNVTVTTVESGKKMSEYAVFAASNAKSLQNTNKNGWIIAFPSQLELKGDLLCSFPFWLKRIWNFGHIYSIILYLDSSKTFMVMLIMFLFLQSGYHLTQITKVTTWLKSIQKMLQKHQWIYYQVNIDTDSLYMQIFISHYTHCIGFSL